VYIYTYVCICIYVCAYQMDAFSHPTHLRDQGGGKRPGAFAVYLEPWHAEIFDFLELKKNSGSEEFRARDLFYALWIPDLFMQRCKVCLGLCLCLCL